MIPGRAPGVEELARGLECARVSAGVPELAALVPRRPGLYAWWADEKGRTVLAAALGAPLPELIYAGQAGAASSRSGAPSAATLRSRILGNHLGGQISASTFRRTLGASLVEALELRLLSRKRLDQQSSAALTDWMRAHLSVGWVAMDDRSAVGRVEEALLVRLDPPLNLQGMSVTPLRAELRRRRRALGADPPYYI